MSEQGRRPDQVAKSRNDFAFAAVMILVGCVGGVIWQALRGCA